MNHDPYVYAVMGALILFALYRRFRRLFGRQPFQPTRLKVRIAVLSLVTLLVVVPSVLRASMFASAALAGLAAGVALAYVGLRLTRFDRMPAGLFYTPNGYIGAVLSALLLGRLIYRFQVLYPGAQAAQAAGGNPYSMIGSPLTIAVFGIVIGYYLAYYIGLLIRGDAFIASGSTIAQPADTASPPLGP